MFSLNKPINSIAPVHILHYTLVLVEPHSFTAVHDRGISCSAAPRPWDPSQPDESPTGKARKPIKRSSSPTTSTATMIFLWSPPLFLSHLLEKKRKKIIRESCSWTRPELVLEKGKGWEERECWWWGHGQSRGRQQRWLAASRNALLDCFLWLAHG